MNKPFLVACITAAQVLWVAGPAAAEQSCPTSQDADNAILEIDGLSRSSGNSYDYYIGMVDFYGSRIVAACVRSDTLGTESLHAITDQSGWLLAHLPRQENHLCLSNTSSVQETTYVLERNRSLCGVTMYPLDYHGNTLVQYGRRGNDHLHGGLGTDIIYGGYGNDTISDYDTDTSVFEMGILYGESGNDRIFGGSGWTALIGGSGVDGLADIGGFRDALDSGSGNDCCVYAAQISALTPLLVCGSGSADVVRSMDHTKNCEVQSSWCGPSLLSCF